ncbi:hypothetical protein ACFLS4_01770 [Bacteroidota bacterium]
MGKTIAKIFSILFHPLLLPTIGLIILYNSGSVLEYLPYNYKNIYLLIVIVCTFALPLTFVPFFIFQKIIKNVKMENNRERLLPFFITFILYLLCYYLIAIRIGAPETISRFILAAAVATAILFLLSFKWKISAHMTGIGGLTGALIAVSFRLNVNLELFIIAAVIISGLIGYSRLNLNTHKQYQVYIGWLTGIFVSITVLLF